MKKNFDETDQKAMEKSSEEKIAKASRTLDKTAKVPEEPQQTCDPHQKPSFKDGLQNKVKTGHKYHKPSVKTQISGSHIPI